MLNPPTNSNFTSATLETKRPSFLSHMISENNIPTVPDPSKPKETAHLLTRLPLSVPSLIVGAGLAISTSQIFHPTLQSSAIRSSTPTAREDLYHARLTMPRSMDLLTLNALHMCLKPKRPRKSAVTEPSHARDT